MSVFQDELADGETLVYWTAARRDELGLGLSGVIRLTNRRLVFDTSPMEIPRPYTRLEVDLREIEHVEMRGHFIWTTLRVMLDDGRIHVFSPGGGLGLGKFTRKLIEQLELTEDACER